MTAAATQHQSFGSTNRARGDRGSRPLEQGLSVAQTGRRRGFGSEEPLRRAFLRRLGASPQAYRERFAGWTRMCTMVRIDSSEIAQEFIC